MNKIYLLIGIQGSGKSTYAKKLSEKENIDIVSTDTVRIKNKGIDEKEVWPTVYKTIAEVIKEKDVIFDATSTTPKVRDRLKENLFSFGLVHNKDYEICALFFPTAPITAVKRVDKRNKLGEYFVPLDIIPSFDNNIIPPTYAEEFKEAKVISNAKDLLKPFGEDSYHGYALYLHDPKTEDVDLYEASGFANIETGERVRLDSCFRLASVSKQFIAYGILTLVKDNKLKLEDTLYSCFNDMPLYTKDITITNLLNHTSGIRDYDEEIDHTEMDKLGTQVSDLDVLNWVKTTKDTYFEIGSKYQYSNTAYILLGLIIKEKSGMEIGDYLDEVIFKPFNMTTSKVDYEGITKFEKRALGHIRKDGRLYVKDQYWCSATIGDGGIYSNIIDLVKWLKVIRSLDGIYKKMITPNIINGVNTEYGFGLRIKEINGHKLVYHNGWTIGTNTSIGYIEDLDVEWAFLINEHNLGTEMFIEEIKRKYLS